MMGLRLLLSQRMLVMLALGFSSGLPFALVGPTLQAWFTVEGASLIAIGWLGMLAQPYTFKVLWAPILDRFSLPWLGRRRGWMLSTQVLLFFLLMGMAFFHPSVSPMGLLILAGLVAFVSATQDIVVDAYRTEVLLPTERGYGSAVYIGGYRVAMMVSGGLALMLSSAIGWQWTYLLMAFAMLVGVITTLTTQKELVVIQPTRTWSQTFIEPLHELWSRPAMGIILLFIILYKLDVQLVNSMLMPFLLREVGFNLSTVGFATQVLGLIATMVGVLLGGLLLTRFNLMSMLLIFGVLQAFSTLFFAGLDQIGPNKLVMYSLISFENFCAGLGTAALMAFMMSLCHIRYTATQFALLSALGNFGRVALAPLAGVIIEQIGWTQFYVWAFIIALPALALLWLKRGVFIHPVEVATI
jgi:PAT family beta-lactamase induction signal transducer AmpG